MRQEKMTKTVNLVEEAISFQNEIKENFGILISIDRCIEIMITNQINDSINIISESLDSLNQLVVKECNHNN